MPGTGGVPRALLRGSSHVWDPGGGRIYYVLQEEAAAHASNSRTCDSLLANSASCVPDCRREHGIAEGTGLRYRSATPARRERRGVGEPLARAAQH